MDAFADRLAIVTGASDGIGLACARKLAEQGARVVVNARRAGRLDELVEIDPARVVPVAGDASRPDTIEAMLDAAARLGGRQADLVIANAGRGLAGSPLGSDPTQWPAVVEVNLLGAAMLIRRAAERMLAEIDQQPPTQAAAHAAGPASRSAGGAGLDRRRDVVVLGSTVGRNLSPFSSFYGATKAAIHMVAEAVRREVGPRGVRVTTIEPGVVASGFQDAAGYDPVAFGRFMEQIAPVLTPDDVAEAILWACARPAGVHLSEIMIRPTRQDYP